MKKWQIENSGKSEISEISEKLFRVFLFPCFRFCPTAKIENSDLKISEKNFQDFRGFDLADIFSYIFISLHQGLYPSGTTVIVGDSIINGVIAERINKKDRPVKVRNFPGATVADMEHYLIPIIQKKPSNIILHVRTNDAKNLPLRTALDNLLKLKALVKDSLPTCKVFISTPALRTDDGEAQITVSQLTKHLLQLKIDTVNNNYINIRHLGGKDLRLNQSGSKLLSKNFLNAIEKF